MSVKYVIIVPDGAADEPIEAFGGKTVIEAAQTPNIDRISIDGRQGIVRTVPPGLTAGSDVAMMSLLGYDPIRYYTGRAPLEAAAMNIKLEPDDWVFRCNLVTIADGKMADYSAGHISTKEATTLIEDLQSAIGSENIRFYPGLSYRHLCVIKGTQFKVQTQPPHDILDQKISRNLPSGKNAEILTEIMALSQQLFENHDINRVRKDLHENHVSSVWLWGQGQKAALEKFSRRYGVKGAVITAVDLVKGLARLMGLAVIEVQGATGFVDTNYAGKGLAAIEGLKEYDLVLVHIEAPDEAGHTGNEALKKKTIEQIDRHIVGPVYDAIRQYETYRILVMPDHPTPVRTRGHSGEPVPFAMAGAGVKGVLHKPWSEQNARQSGFRIDRGCDLMEYFLKI